MQQLIIVKNFIKNNNIKTKVVSCKTIREKNGIAYSSRNVFLTQKQKKIASKVYHIIHKAKKKIIRNFHHIKKIKIKIINMGIKKIDYIEIININKLIKPYQKKRIYKIFIAYYLGKTRLIDNI